MLYDKATHFGNYEMCLISDLSTITEEGMVIELDPTKDSVNGVPYGRVATGETQVLGVSVHEVRRPSLLRGVVDFTSSGTGADNVDVKVALGHAAVANSVVVLKLDADGNPATYVNLDGTVSKLLPKKAVDRSAGAAANVWESIGAAIPDYADAAGYAADKAVLFNGTIRVNQSGAATSAGDDPNDEPETWLDRGPVADVPVYANNTAYEQHSVVEHNNEYYVAKVAVGQGNVVVPGANADAVAEEGTDNWTFNAATNEITLKMTAPTNNVENSTKYRAMFTYMPTVQELDFMVGDRKPRHTPEQWDTDVGIGIGLLTAGMIGTSMFEPGYWKVGDRVKSGPGGLLVPATIKDYNDAGSTPNVMENWLVSHTPGPTVDNENYLGIRKHPAR